MKLTKLMEDYFQSILSTKELLIPHCERWKNKNAAAFGSEDAPKNYLQI